MEHPAGSARPWFVRLPARLAALVRPRIEQQPGARVMLREVERLDGTEVGAVLRALRSAGAAEVALEWAAFAPPTAAWLAAAGADRLDLHADALRVPTARALGHSPATIAWLADGLRAADDASIPARVVLRLGRTALADLTCDTLDALARAAHRTSIEVLLVPRVGDAEEGLRLDELVLHLARLEGSPHRLLRSRAWPACAMRGSLSVDESHDPQGIERVSAPACAPCPARAERACDGLTAPHLAALEDERGEFADASVLDAERLVQERRGPALASIDPIELAVRALALGLRRVARVDDLDEERALALAAEVDEGQRGGGRHAGSGLHALVARPTHLAADGTLDVPTEANGGRRLLLVLLARDLAAARRALEIERVGGWPDDNDELQRALGEEYGYPSCCVESFIAEHRVWRDAPVAGVAENAWLLLRAARRGLWIDPRLDLISAAQTRTFTRHFPCRFDCAASLAISDAILDDLARDRPALPAAIRAGWPTAVLLGADNVNLSLDGEVTGPGLLSRPRLRPLSELSHNSATVALRRRLAPVVHRAAALRAPRLDGAGSVTVVGRDGSERPLDAAPVHADFPRLLFFDRVPPRISEMATPPRR